ncbi:MAG: phosphoglycerate dehydrogenase, partial [Bryobacterales bacterium]|nr:phosphoglycerate dehydrogenase [Bryobacterales bacterium]
MKVLVADAVDAAAIETLRAEDAFEVVVSNPQEYERHLGTATALIVRSAVKVTAAVMERAPRLRVIGPAGVGVDNIDCEEATTRGIVVLNTPGGNATAVA